MVILSAASSDSLATADALPPDETSDVFNYTQSCDLDLHVPISSLDDRLLDKKTTAQAKDIIVNTTAIEQSIELSQKLSVDSICKLASLHFLEIIVDTCRCKLCVHVILCSFINFKKII